MHRSTTVCRFVTAALFAVTAATINQTAHAEPASEACVSPPGFALLASPHAPWKGAPLRVMLTLDEAAAGEMTLVAPDGRTAAATRETRGGPPYFWYAEVPSPSPGKWQVTLNREGAACPSLSREITVAKSNTGTIGGGSKSVWPLRGAWNRANENLYSAWIEKLFDAPLEESLSWKALHEVLRDPSRNALFNHMGAREDEKNQIIKPDCADLPYFLRAYFAFKMGLPFGYAKCTRGSASAAPRCPQWWSIVKEEPAPQPQSKPPAKQSGIFDIFDAPEPETNKPVPRPPGLTNSFGFYLRNIVANSVHSGSGRTAFTDDNTDYYPVALDQSTLRPGTIYADPYGHILVLVKRVAQTDGAAGVFLAVDGQPDGTVARKRFWRGNFLFATDPAVGGPGFKRFRPIVAEKGSMRRLSNAEIARNSQYGDFSLDQSKLTVEEFYDRMDDVMSPAPLDPKRAMLEAITSLDEQVKTRVTSVENGRKYQVTGSIATMPDGAAIFETTGAWEDFATPSRDLRLLIAIDVVRGFPERVSRRPERYAMPAGKSPADVKSDLEATLARELAGRSFTYTRTDGSPFTLTIKDVVERAGALEMAYNVNDCAELRWGAPDGSTEAATCKGKAPESQRAKMSKYRAWFAERRRPARGVE